MQSVPHVLRKNKFINTTNFKHCDNTYKKVSIAKHALECCNKLEGEKVATRKEFECKMNGD